MKQYAVETRFAFSGCFFIAAENKAQAREYAEKHCGLVLGRGIHTALPDDMADWEFPAHPEKTIGRISIKKEEQGYEQTP
jgi:hypothetical protein